RIETWELLTNKIGTISFGEYSFERYDAILSRAIDTGVRIYSAAYIMPSGGSSLAFGRKHQMHLKLLEQMMQDELPVRLADAPSMRKAFDLLRSSPTIGDFLAYQYVTDLNYSSLTNFSEMEFVVPGPGARDGIRKCFSDLGGLNEAQIIKLVADRQQTEFDHLGLDFLSLWGRPLQLIDCQNLFCEVDKYARVKHPEIEGITGRMRIKQRYRINPNRISVWYPPKWGLNERIAGEYKYVPTV
ncbi:MAG: nucleotide kinase domain-containing protein, partial [Pyrinomonadaceae bacterium]